tara:strand:+ start:342 stop:1307 length:966 start_codon:yes stop_codon:yes gene_type:complete
MWVGNQQLEKIYKSLKQDYSFNKIVTTVINKLNGKNIIPVYIKYNFYSFLNRHDRHHILNIDELNEITVNSDFVLKVPKNFLEKGFFSFQKIASKYCLNATLHKDENYYYLYIKNADELLKNNNYECSHDNLRKLLISGTPFTIKLQDDSYFMIHTSGYSDGIFMEKKVYNTEPSQPSPFIVSEIKGNESDEDFGLNNVLEYCKRYGTPVILDLFIEDIKKNIKIKQVTHYIHHEENGLGGCAYITVSPNGSLKIKKPHIYIHLLCASPDKENKVKGHMLLNSITNFAKKINIKYIYISSIINPIDTFLWWKKQGFSVIYE